MKILKKFLHRNTTIASEGDIVFQSWLLQLPPARGLKKYLCKSHWRWVVFRYTGPQEGILECYSNDRCTRLTSRIRITRKDKVESGMSFNPGVSTNQLNMFSISSERQIHYLVAETQKEAEYWVLALCSACGLDLPKRTAPLLESQHGRQKREQIVDTSVSEDLLLPDQSDEAKVNNSDYILLSSCFSSGIPSNENPCDGKRTSFPSVQEKNLCLSSHHLNYDHPKPIARRSRLMTSPDLRNTYSHPRALKQPSNPNLSHKSIDAQEVSDNIWTENCDPSTSSDCNHTERTHYERQNAVISPNRHLKLSACLETSKLKMRKDAQELESSGTRTKEDEPPPRPPKPHHLSQTSISHCSDIFMIHADLVFPIYDTIPKPRGVFQHAENQMEPSGNSCISSKQGNNPQNKHEHKIDENPPFMRHQASQEQNKTNIKISPNTRVSRPLGGLWDSRMKHFNNGYDHPKFVNHDQEDSQYCLCSQSNLDRTGCEAGEHITPNIQHAIQRMRIESNNKSQREIANSECFTSTTEHFTRDYSINPVQDPKTGVKMRRRPPTPPTTKLCGSSLQSFSADLETTVSLTANRNLSSKKKQMRPLTQEQRLSISKEMNYLDLAFVADGQDYSNPRPLTRETVYYSVDFIRTWAFNATRKDVEEIYRNMQEHHK